MLLYFHDQQTRTHNKNEKSITELELGANLLYRLGIVGRVNDSLRSPEYKEAFPVYFSFMSPQKKPPVASLLKVNSEILPLKKI